MQQKCQGRKIRGVKFWSTPSQVRYNSLKKFKRIEHHRTQKGGKRTFIVLIHACRTTQMYPPPPSPCLSGDQAPCISTARRTYKRSGSKKYA